MKKNKGLTARLNIQDHEKASQPSSFHQNKQVNKKKMGIKARQKRKRNNQRIKNTRHREKIFRKQIKIWKRNNHIKKHAKKKSEEEK